MATHAYIIQAENELAVMPSDQVQDVMDAYRREGIVDGTGRPYPENRNLWRALYFKACNTIGDNRALAPLVDLLEVEFG